MRQGRLLPTISISLFFLVKALTYYWIKSWIRNVTVTPERSVTYSSNDKIRWQMQNWSGSCGTNAFKQKWWLSGVITVSYLFSFFPTKTFQGFGICGSFASTFGKHSINRTFHSTTTIFSSQARVRESKPGQLAFLMGSLKISSEVIQDCSLVKWSF